LLPGGSKPKWKKEKRGLEQKDYTHKKYSKNKVFLLTAAISHTKKPKSKKKVAIAGSLPPQVNG